MSAGTISVAPAALASAGRTFASARATAASTITTLAKALDDNWGCAGTDDKGKAFAGTYDPAAFNAVASGADIVNGLGQLNDLLQYTSVNHANGNTRAAIGTGPADTVHPPAATPHYDTPRFKGSYGGNTDAPFGWGLITRWLQGRVWPNAHQDKLQHLDNAWHDAATSLETMAKALPAAREAVADQISDEIPQILAQIDLVTGDITATISEFRDLGDKCFDYADAVSQCHDAIGKALGEVVIAAGVGALLGSVIGPEGTAGGGTLAAGAAGEIAGGACVAAIDTLGAATGGIAGALAGAAVAAGPLTKNLQPLLDSKPTQVNTNTRGPGNVPKFDGAANKPYRQTDAVDWDGESAAQDARNDWANSGATQRDTRNIAVAQADVDGQYIGPDVLRTTSARNVPKDAIGDPAKPMFEATPPKPGEIARDTDGEYRILNDLATRLKPDSTGTVDLYTENEPCQQSCQQVIKNFEAKFPGVKVNVTYTNPTPQ